MKGLERYNKISQIQAGAYGIIYKCFDVVDKMYYAMKECDYDESCIREIKALSVLKHPTIISLIDQFPSQFSHYIIMELGGEDLHSKIEREGPIPINSVKNIMKQILEGLCFIHENGWIHRDIKPSNILLNEDQSVRIIDFGLSRSLSGNPLSPCRFTTCYASLDTLLGAHTYNQKVDIWGAGCTLAQMILGKPLFTGDNQISVILEILKMFGSPSADEWPEMASIDYFTTFKLPSFEKTYQSVFPENTDPLAIDLIIKMLNYSESKRLSASQALEHPFFE